MSAIGIEVLDVGVALHLRRRVAVTITYVQQVECASVEDISADNIVKGAVVMVRPRLDDCRGYLVGTLTAPAHTCTTQDVVLKQDIQHIVLLEGILTPQKILYDIDAILHQTACIAHIFHREQLLRVALMLMGKGGIFNRAVGMVLGAFVFRLVYTVALRMNMPAYMLKLVSSAIVVIAIFLPYLKKQMPLMRRAMAGKGKGGN